MKSHTGLSSFRFSCERSLSYHLSNLSLIALETMQLLVRKLFSFSRYLNFCLHFLVRQKKQFYYKDKVSFKIYDVTTWLTNNYNKHIAQLSLRSKGDQTIKIGQLVKYDKRNSNFYSKIMEKMSQGNQFQISFCFFKKALYEVKEASGLQPNFNIF